MVSHCLFWSKEKQLAFFQDVSDRIEKEPSTSPVMQSLEQGGLKVVRGDWRANISEEVREGTLDKHIANCYMAVFNSSSNSYLTVGCLSDCLNTSLLINTINLRFCLKKEMVRTCLC